ncbi:unnamed protein product [Closterium sp. NIES-53]
MSHVCPSLPRCPPYSRRSKQPGPITRLLSCTEKQLKDYPNMDLAPTHTVPSMSLDPKTGEWLSTVFPPFPSLLFLSSPPFPSPPSLTLDSPQAEWVVVLDSDVLLALSLFPLFFLPGSPSPCRYPAINKPYGVWHWVQHSPQAQQAEWVVILDADMVIRAPVTPWGVKAEKGKPVAAYYGYVESGGVKTGHMHLGTPVCALEEQQAERVVILDADMAIRAPVTPWGVKAKKATYWLFRTHGRCLSVSVLSAPHLLLPPCSSPHSLLSPPQLPLRL